MEQLYISQPPPQLLDEVADFFIKYSPYKDRELIKDYARQHLEYHTAIVLRDDLGIKSVARWNMEGNTAVIFDVVIRPDCRYRGLLKEMIRIGKQMWQDAEYISFQRVWKYNDTEKTRIYKIHDLLKE